MNAYYSLMDKLFPSDDPEEDYIHVWVGIIALAILLYLVAVKRAFGSRAI